MGAQPVPGDKTDKVSCVQQKQNWPQDSPGVRRNATEQVANWLIQNGRTVSDHGDMILASWAPCRGYRMRALSGEAMSRDRRCQKPPTDPRMPERRNLRDPEPAKCPPLLGVRQFPSSDELCMQTVTMASTQTTLSRIAYVWRPDARLVWTRRKDSISVDTTARRMAPGLSWNFYQTRPRSHPWSQIRIPISSNVTPK